MTRRNIQRVDYKNVKPLNISSSDESCHESDDDFVVSLTPPKKKTKSTKKRKDDATSNKSNLKICENFNAEPKRRKTRTSNADVCLEQDLKTAIEISENDTVSSSPGYNDEDESDFECEKDNKPSATNKKKTSKKSDTKTMKCDKENLDTVELKPPDHNDENTPKVDKTSIISPDKLPKKKVKTLSLITVDTKIASKAKAVSNVGMSTSNVNNKRQSLISNTSESSGCYTNKIITPGRLRLGLSRNKKVTKPLHANVTIT